MQVTCFGVSKRFYYGTKSNESYLNIYLNKYFYVKFFRVISFFFIHTFLISRFKTSAELCTIKTLANVGSEDRDQSKIV